MAKRQSKPLHKGDTFALMNNVKYGIYLSGANLFNWIEHCDKRQYGEGNVLSFEVMKDITTIRTVLILPRLARFRFFQWFIFLIIIIIMMMVMMMISNSRTYWMETTMTVRLDLCYMITVILVEAISLGLIYYCGSSEQLF